MFLEFAGIEGLVSSDAADRQEGSVQDHEGFAGGGTYRFGEDGSEGGQQFDGLAANIDIDDLNSERRYRRWVAYARSKTANLLFTHELARRLATHGADVVAAAAHPGYAATNLQAAGPRMAGRRVVERFMAVANRFFAQSAQAGALPTLYAATAPDVPPDSFTGPSFAGWRGAPAPSWRAPWTLDDRAGERLWAASERLTGVFYEALKAA